MSLPPPPLLTNRHALFVDFDGTLAPLQDNADTVRISTAKIEILLKLAEQREGALAILSGRDIRDLASRTPESLYRIGNHGLYELKPCETYVPELDPLPDAIRRSLEAVAATRDGVYLEVKGPVGTIHYRANPDAGTMLIDAVKTIVATKPTYRSKAGNHVVEAIPAGANKGMALARTMEQAPFKGRIPVMVGDDTTDEDGFLAAQRLGGFGVRVGDGETVARKWLMDVESVWEWLDCSLNGGPSDTR